MMINKDRKLIADYMNWSIVNVGTKKRPYVLYVDTINCNIHHHFDANSASTCAQEMQKRGGDYWHFYLVAEDLYRADEEGAYIHCNETEPCAISRWLFNTDNFFTALAAWIKEGKK